MQNQKLTDKFNRNLNYLRISITDRCNLRCIYCSPDNNTKKINHNEILRYEEILRIVEVGVKLGISKIRITGGEPLMRKGVLDFLKALNNISGLTDLSITTNGVFLKENINGLVNCGIKRINISLDTLKRDKFKQITGFDYFNNVWDAIIAAYESGFKPIKLNMVALPGINDDEFLDFAKLSLNYPFHIRFIEYMPIGNSKINSNILADDIMERLKVLGNLIQIDKKSNDGPAERYKIESAKGEIGFIRPISRHFCNFCNRLRLTADGNLRVCLLSDFKQDIKTAIRSNCKDSEIADIILDAISHKKFKHNILPNDNNKKLNFQMYSIGG